MDKRNLEKINKNTGEYFHVIDNIGNSVQSIDKEEAWKKIKELFDENLYSSDFEKIKEVRNQKITNEIKQNVMEKFNGTCEEEKVKISITNSALLEQLFIGGSIASDRIYKRQ